MMGLSAPSFVAAAGLAAHAWLPQAAAQGVERSDNLFRLLLLGTGFALGLVLLFIDVQLFRSTREPDASRRPDAPRVRGRSKPTAWLWAVALLAGVLAVTLFVTGLDTYVDRWVAPARAMSIDVQGQQNGWSFTYNADLTTDELHVPAEQPVRLRLKSADVEHRLSVPRLRLQQSIWPGHPNEVWFTAATADTLTLRGAAYTGASFDSMLTRVIVHEPGGFADWLASASSPLGKMPLADAGRVLIERNGCLVCHSTDGTRGTGPSFLGVLGQERAFEDGSTVVADSLYVREAILEPQARVVAGFKPVMPSFQGKLGDPEIGAIVAYFESLVAGPEEEE